GPGTTSGGGGAKASASCPAGSRHALTPRSTAATSASAPSGVAATTVTGCAKSSVQRGARAAPGLPASTTQPCTGTPAAPAPPAPRGGSTWSSPRLSSRRRGRTRPPGRARGAAADGAPACGRARIAAGVGAHKREKRDEVSQRPRWPVLLPLLVDSTRVARLEHLVPRGTHG